MTANDIKLDLTAGKGRPEWVFSAYAPNNKVPRQLFGGPQRELSMEELRLRHYEAAAAGNMNQAVQEAQALWQESVNQMEAALNDVNGAIKYIVDGANEHPNRIDICQGQTGAQTNQSTPFGQPSAPAAPTGAFGNPTPAAPTAFGKPAFGQPAQPSPFGKPSAPGNPTPFGQPSALGGSSAFGQPSTLGAGTAFGQPSGLGAQGGLGKPAFGQSGFAQAASKPAFGQTGFGNLSQPAAGGAAPFGTPSAASPFSQVQQPQQPQQPSPFGQPSAPANPFGAPAQQPTAPGFGQPSGGSGFGQPAQTASPFGQPQQPQQTQPAPFGQPTAASNPFGAPAQQPAASSPFGQPAAPQGVPVQGTSTGPRAFIKIDNPAELNPLPELQGQTMRNPSTRQLTMWKGRPVKYINDAPCYLHPQDNKTFVRINFPNGPPEEAALRESQGKPEEYTPEIEQMYKFFLDNGVFKDGIIPAVPPKREWISFDF